MDFRPIYLNLFTTIYGLLKVLYLVFCCILLLLFFSSSVRSPVTQLLTSLHLHFLHLSTHIFIVIVKFLSLHDTRIRAGGMINVAASDTYVRTVMIFLPVIMNYRASKLVAGYKRSDRFVKWMWRYRTLHTWKTRQSGGVLTTEWIRTAPETWSSLLVISALLDFLTKIRVELIVTWVLICQTCEKIYLKV